MALAIMSHRLESWSPLTRMKLSSETMKSPAVKNLQIQFDEEFSLPLIKRSSHPDLKRISSQTLASLLHQSTSNMLIVDARYPFEYAGGHIISAINIYTDGDLRLLFTKLVSSTCRPSIIVFHCEFSSERAPRLCRLFRSLDRQFNLSTYPHLTFPSVYLLDGGYADFYQHSIYKQFCEPVSYTSMFAQQFEHELKVYRRAKRIANGTRRIDHLHQQQDPIQLCLS